LAERGLVVFADYVCPFCRLAEAGLGRLRAEGVPVDAAAFELRPPGTPLPAPDASWLQASWQNDVEPLAAELGITMRYPTLMTRTGKAHEAAAYARNEGALDVMHEALYRAWWEEGRDIGRIDVLTEIAAEVGLDAAGLRVALDIDAWTERVERDRLLAERLKLAGVPAYLSTGGNVGLRTGLQLYDDLKTWVTRDDV
jgi:predicted DsbA family dithiol-disulfide isomerase